MESPPTSELEDNDEPRLPNALAPQADSLAEDFGDTRTLTATLGGVTTGHLTTLRLGPGTTPCTSKKQ
jgi:hypothetical protein